MKIILEIAKYIFFMFSLIVAISVGVNAGIKSYFDDFKNKKLSKKGGNK